MPRLSCCRCTARVSPSVRRPGVRPVVLRRAPGRPMSHGVRRPQSRLQTQPHAATLHPRRGRQRPPTAGRRTVDATGAGLRQRRQVCPDTAEEGRWPGQSWLVHMVWNCRAQWLRGRASASRLREPGFESCDAVLKPWASFFTLHCSSSLSCING